MTQASVIAFAGPCLPAKPDREWQQLLDGVDLRPPARRGDVLAALADTPDAIVLLDGLYYTVPSVSHQELLYAVDAGVMVIGAASMGALRAAELERHGMVGIGRVFRWYRDGVLEGDDEVALLHLDRDFDYRPLTIALIEIRWALDHLAPFDERPAEVDCFVDAVKALPFTPAKLKCSDVVGRRAPRQLDRAAVEGEDGVVEPQGSRQQAGPLAR